MSILTRIKRLLGLESSAEWEGEQPAAVTVEHEPEAEEEEAEEGTDDVEAPEADPADDPVEERAAESEGDEGDAGEPVTSIDGIGPTYGERLEEAGVDTIDALADADPENLAGVTDIAESRLVRWIEAAQQRTSG